MMICAYCGKDAPENPHQSCCGEIHFIEADECPTCGSLDAMNIHRDGDMVAQECDYKACQECGAQWGHQ